ncbi:MAG: glycoside hydrolase family 127 protein [Bacteroidaceae bacterium]|nr:glycoside hydrolase family 127 protein [Bacteroidaceae bacterium]
MACATTSASLAQSKLYPHLFDLKEVTLSEGMFKTALDLNNATLLEYDVDRLLTPYFRQAGFSNWETQHPNFPNWGSGNFRLDGHVGGHYLSALALAYAATEDEAMRAQMKERMEYMIDKMAQCQAVFDNNTDGLYGYVGGLPDNSVWTSLYHGDLTKFNQNRGNVPLYTIHKVFAGFRDAWLYAGNEKARECFLKMCDWGVNLISNLNDSQLQDVLNTEHGGINEMFADAYQMTGDERYLTAAHRYAHRTMIEDMQTVNTEFLSNKHANTQVPKYIGFLRLAQQKYNTKFHFSNTQLSRSAHNFWTDVVENRTVALGGNSVNEHFVQHSNSHHHITMTDGPESCNTNNMLKLTEDLFADEASGKYGDFYEMAMFNHILSTQHPETGGYVYFTSLRPQHYRMYSQVNQGMWCCVGTGMENHSKYGEFIYSRNAETNTLYVNLFVASQLKNDTYALTQQTRFPYEQGTTLTIEKAGTYTIAIRKPSWCSNLGLSINGTTKEVEETNGYIHLKGSWKVGDVINVSLPMQLNYLPCPGYDAYIALRYGPILLGAITSTENLTGQHAGEGRMDHAPGQGTQLSLTSAPMLIGNRAHVLDSIYMIDSEKLHFKIRPGLYNSERWTDLILQPFYTIHEARYMTYWQQLTAKEWEEIRQQVMAEEEALMQLNNRTLDFVATGEQQSDAGHALQGTFGKGSYDGEFYIDAQSGQWFSYQLATQGIKENVSLMCRFHSADAGRIITISVNDKHLTTMTLEQKNFSGHYNWEHPISEEQLMIDGTLPDSITVRFHASGNTPAPGLYYLRLLKDYEPKPLYTFICTQWVSGDDGRVNKVTYDTEANTITVYGKQGNNNIALQYATYYDDHSYITHEHRYFTVCGSPLRRSSSSAYLWWLGGANHGTQVPPTYTAITADGQSLFVWDITQSGLNDYMKDETISFSANGKAMNTVFGLTSTKADGTATISDISFYTRNNLVSIYPEMQKFLGVPDDISTPLHASHTGAIYSLNGAKIASHTDITDLDESYRGIYIIGNKKWIK